MYIALITNIPTPYRVPVFSLLATKSKLSVLFCSENESNRSWSLPNFSFTHFFLQGKVHSKSDGFNYVHNNPEIWRHLSKSKPDIVVTTGFNPTHLYAFLWAKLHGARHVCMTDGTMLSESGLSWKHRLIRRLVFAGSHAFIAASRSGMALYQSYGVSSNKIYQSHLCADNSRFFEVAGNDERPYDVLFSGRFHDGKLPLFFADVCKGLLQQRGRCRALLMGDGPLQKEVERALTRAGVEFDFAGFVQQHDLPVYYSKAKILLFPTRGDTWGVVANEAMAAGTPIVTTPYAGVAGELVIDGETGFVREPDVDFWVEAATRLLNDDPLRRQFAVAGRSKVTTYNYQAAADGIEAACHYALSGDNA